MRGPAAAHVAVAAVLLVWCMVTALALVPLSRAVAVRLGVMDAPGRRKIHSVPTPRLGGVAVFVAFVHAVVGGYFAVPWLSAATAASFLQAPLTMLAAASRVEDKLFGLLVGATIAFLTGAADDVLGVRFPVLVKLGGQFLAAAVLVVSGVRTTVMPHETLNVALTLLWVVGITNAFNFLDNMDGLCAGVAAVASWILLIHAWSRGEFFVALVLVAFIGSLLGFLRHNFTPASVFLGDCGSHFIGFMMAALTLLERYVSDASSTVFPVLMPLLVLAVPILDTSTVVFIRLRQHRPVYRGDTSHLSHRLVALGFSTRKAVLSMYLTAFGFGLGAIALPDATPAQSVILLCQTLVFAALLVVLMFHERPAAAPEQAA